jgi:hypothetical protein
MFYLPCCVLKLQVQYNILSNKIKTVLIIRAMVKTNETLNFKEGVL